MSVNKGAVSVAKVRWLLVVALSTTTGCDAVREAFSADEEYAAVAASARLPADRLGQMLGSARQAPVSPQAVRVLANLWIDYTLVAIASADGDSLADSATIAAAAWAPFRQRLVDEFHTRLLENRIADIDTAMVDSVYRQGDFRILDHILVLAGGDLAPDQRAEKRSAIEGLQRQIDDGAAFGALAAEHSEDASRDRNGRLGLLARGETVRPFEDVGWMLAPGEVSDVVETMAGYHLVRRPPLEDVRSEFEAGLARRVSAQFDSIYLDSLTEARNVRVARDAPTMVRDALSRFEELSDSRRTLARYQGGKLTVSDFVYWITGYPQRTRSELATSSDSVIEAFVGQITRSEILVGEAEQVGITLGPDDWQEIRRTYLSQIGFLRATIGIDPAALADSAASRDDRRRLAQVRVEAYLRDLLADRKSLIEPPAYLSFLLRDRLGGRVRGEGLQTAFERAQQVRAGLPPEPQPAAPGAPPGLPPAGAGPPPQRP
jgi:hypothetical protein